MSKKIKTEILDTGTPMSVKKEKLDEDLEEGIDPLENVEVDMDLPHTAFGHSIFDHNMRTYKCRECMMLFPNQHLLYHHQQKSHISQVKPQFKKVDQSSFGKFKCSYCTSQFSSAPSLKSHISRVHMCSTNNQQSAISTMMVRLQEFLHILHNGGNDSHKRQFLALGVCSQSWKLNNLSKNNFLSN